VKYTVMFVVALVGIVPASAEMFVMLSGGNRPSMAQVVEEGCMVTLIPRTATDNVGSFAMKLPDDLQMLSATGLPLALAPREIPVLSGEVVVEGGALRGVTLDGNQIGSEASFQLNLAGLALERHVLVVQTDVGSATVDLDLIEGVRDLGAQVQVQVPAVGAIQPISNPVPSGVVEVVETPSAPAPTSTSSTTSGAYLSDPTEEARIRDFARERGYTGDIFGRGTFRLTKPGWDSTLIILQIRGGRICYEDVRIDFTGDHSADWNASKREFPVVWLWPKSVRKVGPEGIRTGAVPDCWFRVLELPDRGEILVDKTPPAGWGLWLCIVRQ